VKGSHTNKEEELNKKDKDISDGAKAPVASAIALRLVDFFLKKLIEIKPNRTPTTSKQLENWAIEMEKLLKKRTPEQIEAIIKWLPTHEFWKKNIASVGKLHEKLDRLEMEMESKKQNASSENADKNRAYVVALCTANPQMAARLKIDQKKVYNKLLDLEVYFSNHTPEAFVIAFNAISGWRK
jgi:hypothetical protein